MALGDREMDRCPHCGSALEREAAACGSCGRPTVESLEATVAVTGREAVAEDPACGCGGAPVFESGAVVAERYRIERRLGAGGMGTVYRARDLVLDQEVALKFISGPCGVPQREGTPRLLREVQLARRVTHPNICRVHDLGEIRGCPFLSMEYVDGEDLATLLRHAAPLPRKRAALLARQICGGLLAAHEERILHRDLKPANVLVDRHDDVHIADFGIAAAFEDPRRGVTGTPGYLAPELFEGAPASVQSDLYSLGAVLYELYAGEQLFAASSIPELIRLQTRRLSVRVSGIDRKLERILLDCLEPRPKQRPRSVREVLAVLELAAGRARR